MGQIKNIKLHIVTDIKTMNESRGTEKNDPGALTEEQQTLLNKFKVKTHIENEKYLREHPEIECLIQSFIRDVCTERPDNLKEYAAQFFNNPELTLQVAAMAQAKQSDIKGSHKLVGDHVEVIWKTLSCG